MMIHSDNHPRISSTRIETKFCIRYRNNYYYSMDSKRPYVRLKIHESSQTPLIMICSKLEYERFLTQWSNGLYRNIPFEIIRPRKMSMAKL